MRVLVANERCLLCSGRGKETGKDLSARIEVTVKDVMAGTREVHKGGLYRVCECVHAVDLAEVLTAAENERWRRNVENMEAMDAADSRQFAAQVGVNAIETKEESK